MEQSYKFFVLSQGFLGWQLFCQKAEEFIDELTNKIDCVICTDLLEHLEDDNIVLDNIYKYLKNNGRLVLSVPALNFLFNQRDRAVGHYRRYGRREILNKLKQAGFEIEFVRYWNLLFLPIVYLVKFLPIKNYSGREMSSDSLLKKIIRKILEFDNGTI